MRVMQMLDVSGATANTYDSGDLATGFMTTACNTLYLINMSDLCYNVTFTGGSGRPVVGHLPNNWARPFKVDGNYDSFRITGSNNPTGAGTAAFSHIVVESYYPNEDTSHLSDTPIPIPNTPQANVTTAKYLTNTDDPSGTQVIQITKPGAAGNILYMDNKGQFFFQRENADTSMTPIIQIYPGSAYPGEPSELVLGNDSTHAVEVQGNFIVDSGNSVTLYSPLFMEQGQMITGIGAYDLTINYPSGQNLLFQQNAVTRGYFNTAGSFVASVALIATLLAGVTGSDLTINAPSGNSLRLQAGGVNNMSCWTQGVAINKLYNGGAMSGMTTGTVSLGASGSSAVSHGLAATPSCVLMVTDQSASSGTCSAYSYTSTQFTAFNGAGATLVYRWFAWL